MSFNQASVLLRTIYMKRKYTAGIRCIVVCAVTFLHIYRYIHIYTKYLCILDGVLSRRINAYIHIYIYMHLHIYILTDKAAYIDGVHTA